MYGTSPFRSPTCHWEWLSSVPDLEVPRRFAAARTLYHPTNSHHAAPRSELIRTYQNLSELSLQHGVSRESLVTLRIFTDLYGNFSLWSCWPQGSVRRLAPGLLFWCQVHLCYRELHTLFFMMNYQEITDAWYLIFVIPCHSLSLLHPECDKWQARSKA